MSNIDYSTIPVYYMAEGMQRYIEHGVRGGSFMHALLQNDLRKAVENADGQNLEALAAWVRWLYNYAPSACWGSMLKVQAWEDSGGLFGMREADGQNNAPQDKTT